MNFKTQAGHWRFAAARFPDAVHFNFDPTFLPHDDYEWIYSYEAIAIDMIIAARKGGAPAAILIHGNPTLAPRTIALRTIVRDAMRDDCATPHLQPADCIECDAAFIAVLRPLTACRSV